MTHYPKITIPHGLSEQERCWVRGIIATRGPNKDRLRASKPKVVTTDLGPDPTDPHGYYRIWGKQGGESAYIWRMVAFYTSPNSKHHCMPCTAELDLPGRARDNNALREGLDEIVKAIVDTVSPLEQYGVHRWGRALGWL